MEKKSLRQQIRQLRSQIPDESWIELCERIQVNAITCIRSLKPSTIGIYIESVKSREVSTKKLIDHCRENNIPIMIPKVIDSNGWMIFTPFTSESTLKLNQWHIPEVESAQMDVDVVPELIIVPMLAGDIKGYRLGYGKGYYDRYLQDKKSIRVGLCPHDFVLNELPSDPFDQKLNFIITEQEIIRTNA